MSFSNYYEVRDWLESYIPLVYGKKELGLERIENLLNKLGSPETKFKSIHIGGTAGKSSTAFYISQLLKNSNQSIKVGLHVSPHLVDIRERMQIDGKLMSVHRFITLFNEIKPVIDDIKSKQPEKTPSYFEILVAASFLHFAKEKVDWAVVEVGLGGRLDATNVLVPKLSVITNVGLDHTEILGNTIEKIATEKAGIIKSRVPIITAATGNALNVIEKVTKARKAPLIKISTQQAKNSRNLASIGDLSIYKDILRDSQNHISPDLYLLAITAVNKLGFHPNAGKIGKAFSVTFAGRFEEIEPDVILDGAHNPDKIGALIDYLKGHSSKIVLVLAFKKGKNWKKMVDLLIKKLPIKEVIATEYKAATDTGLGSAVDSEEIAVFVKKVYGLQTTVYSGSQEAVFNGLQSKIYNPKSTILLVTGSLYLVGEAITLWHLPSF